MSGQFNKGEKKLINCTDVDVNQLMPLKYKWAWEYYIKGMANHWVPTEVSMARDIALWKSDDLSEDERFIIMRNLGFFATAESLVGNNIVLAIFKHVTNPECRQYLLRQAHEEAVHSHTFLYIVESLSLNQKEIFNMYNEVNSIHNKDLFEIQLTRDISDPNFSTQGTANIQKFVENLIGFYVIMEGIFFYSGFVMILSFMRRNKMVGIGEQFQYILRDETVHLNFGIDLINAIKKENPAIWTADFKKRIIEIIDEAVALEIQYAKDCLPNGIFGLNVKMFEEYVKFISNRRLERVGLQAQYEKATNPFPWMSEAMDLVKEKNFFETTVTEYQSSSSLEW